MVLKGEGAELPVMVDGGRSNGSFLSREMNGDFLKDQNVLSVFLESHCVRLHIPQYSNMQISLVPFSYHLPLSVQLSPIEVVLVDSQELTVVLTQNNAGCSRGVVDQCQFPEIVSFVESADDTLIRMYE